MTGAEKQPDGSIAIHFSLAPNEATRSYGYADFLLEFHVTVGTSLGMELVTHNEGTAPLTFENALHTYISIGNIDQTSIVGLEGTTYIDKTDGFKEKQVGSAPLQIAKETDQVHLNTTATCAVEDKAWGREVMVEKSGSESTVVWNPWAQKTSGFADMAPEEWRGMVCVESANASSNAITLAPGATHRLRALVSTA